MHNGAFGSSYEKRTPRERFTRALRRICKRLDKRSIFQIEDRDRLTRQAIEAGFLDASDAVEEVEITRLWVVGSYARGALTCGDLDVLIETRCVDGQPRRVHYRKLVRAALGGTPQLRCYEGTPESNSSRVVFSEAVQIWGPGLDWQAALASIKPNPDAQRFARRGEVVPLRTEQLHRGLETEKELADQYAQGRLSWRFLPIDRSVELDTPTPYETHLLNRIRWGRKTGELIPHVLQYLRDERYRAESCAQIGQTTLDLCGIHFTLGRPHPAVHRLDELTVSRIVAVPHLSKRGPNGLWEILRGPSHPVTKAFADLHAYAIFDEEQCLFLIQGETVDGSALATIAELFSSEALARTHLKRCVEEELLPASTLDTYRIHCVEGGKLLDVIAQADVLELPDGDSAVISLHLTSAGAAVDHATFEPLTPEEMAVALRTALNQP